MTDLDLPRSRYPFAADLAPRGASSHDLKSKSLSLEDGQLDILEFQQMIKVELASHLPGNWRSRCRKIIKLRRAFLNADLDGGGTISRDELEIVLLSSDASVEPCEPPCFATCMCVWRF